MLEKVNHVMSSLAGIAFSLAVMCTSVFIARNAIRELRRKPEEPKKVTTKKSSKKPETKAAKPVSK